ncbi:MAG: FKBP-type peptidyl-prolyl cis-trans isomerase [Phycisphaerae bacterium]
MRKLPTALMLALTSTITLTLVGCGNSGSQQAPQAAAPATPANATAVIPAGATPPAATAAASTQALRVRKLADGLIIKDIKIGNGPEAKDGETAIVHYTGMLMNGKVFDASKLHGNQPFPFVLGAGQVIPGWDIGVKGMRVGGIRELIIPPALAYGDQSPPGSGIPANSTLKFRVHLLGVQAAN